MNLSNLAAYEPTEDELAAEALLYSREPDNVATLRGLLTLRIRHKMLLAECQAMAGAIEVKTEELLKGLRGYGNPVKVRSRKW